MRRIPPVNISQVLRHAVSSNSIVLTFRSLPWIKKIDTCYLHGQLGWSDKILVTCKKTSYTLEDTNDAGSLKDGYADKSKTDGKIPLGPCSYNATLAKQSALPLCGYDVGLF